MNYNLNELFGAKEQKKSTLAALKKLIGLIQDEARIRDLKTQVAINPSNATALKELGRLCVRKKRYQTARLNLQRFGWLQIDILNSRSTWSRSRITSMRPAAGAIRPTAWS